MVMLAKRSERQFPSDRLQAPAQNGAKPAGKPLVFLRLDAQRADRARLAVVNWNREELLRIDLRAFLRQGERYEIRTTGANAARTVDAGVFKGGPVLLRMATPHHNPQWAFGAFDVIRFG